MSIVGRTFKCFVLIELYEHLGTPDPVCARVRLLAKPGAAYEGQLDLQAALSASDGSFSGIGLGDL